MKKAIRFGAKAALFLFLTIISVHMVNRVLTPKYFYNNTWPTTSTYQGFYEMEKNTVDVIFLGSSHAASSFSPQVLYNRYGITSYNLGCEQQNLVVSYYWLKEALRYQKPKAVVLDGYILFPYNREEPLNSAESCTRKALDYMRMSPVKEEAVDTICTIDSKQSRLSYYFPNIRFHSRWTGLNEDDFTYGEMSEHYELKGFTAIPSYSNNESYKPFEAGDSQEEEPMVSLMEEYLDKIVSLCQEENIALILVKTPSTPQTVQRYNTLTRYAEEHQLLFIDFNEKGTFRRLHYDFAKDNCDNGHGSIWGATKITSYLGGVLQGELGLEARIDEQWETTKEYYQDVVQDCTLKLVTDIRTYLKLLNDERYYVFIGVKDEAAQGLDSAILQELKGLGLKGALEDRYRCSYYAVLAEGSVTEQAGDEKISQEGVLRNGRMRFSITSAGYDYGNMCSIKVDGSEYAKNQRGLNIVVYNKITKAVIDSVCFDTHVDGKAIR